MKREQFKNPDQLFRGTDFWMLNGELTEEGIIEQIREMHDKGVYSFIARTYLGLKSDYPGPSFRSKMRLIIDNAKKLGMKLFLQAGYMPEAVPVLPREHALRYIFPVKEGEVDGRRVLCRHGEWVFTEHNSETFLDMFDPDAMDHYLKVSYEDMWAEFSDEYGKTVLSVWVDEPSYNGSYLPYTPRLEELFKERYGYSLSDKIWMLYFDSDEAHTLRYHYRTLMRDLLEENYFKKVRDWCHAHGMMFSGHLMMEETLQSQITRAQACVPYYRYFDIPGIDVLGAEMNWADDPIHSKGGVNKNYNLYSTALQCTSAAHQSGKKHILCEMYGVGGENFTFRNMTHMFDAYASAGINHRCVHGFFYSLKGRGKRAYPPHIGHYQPFWKKYKNVTDYCARVSAFISDGKPGADIAIIHPLETAYMLYRGAIGSTMAGSNELKMLDSELMDLLRAIKSEHLEAEYVDLASLRDMGKVENGKLYVGEMSYGIIVLPKLQVITSKLLELLEKFHGQGGRILVYGNAPTMLDGICDPTLGERIEDMAEVTDSLSSLIDAMPKPSFVIEGDGAENVFINHRICDDGEKLLLYNQDCAREAKITLSQMEGSFYLYDGFSGDISAIPTRNCNGKSEAELVIPVGGSLLISAEKQKNDVPTASQPAKLQSVLNLTGKWDVTPLGENALYLDFCRYRRENGEFSSMIPVLAAQNLLTREEYRGNLTLQFEFETAEALSSLTLALEDPSLHKITLDGRELSNEVCGYYFDTSFEKISIGDVDAGKHILELEREFCPPTKVTNPLTQLFETRHGTELEPIYLLGDFYVKGHKASALNGGVAYERDFKLFGMPKDLMTRGSLTSDGFPFYVGEMLLSQSVTVPEGADVTKASLRLGTMNAGCGEVIINGINIGDINRAPCELSLEGALKNGSNLVQIKLYSTLYNIIGPFHRPQGNIGDTFGGGYRNPDAAWLGLDTTIENWEINRAVCYPKWTDQYNVVPFGVGETFVRLR